MTLTHNDETLTVREWAARLGLSLKALHTRLHRYPDDLKKVLETPKWTPAPLPKPGDVFHRLTVLGTGMRARSDQNSMHARVRCECGNEFWVEIRSIRRGTTKSCGCYRSELMLERHRK